MGGRPAGLSRCGDSPGWLKPKQSRGQIGARRSTSIDHWVDYVRRTGDAKSRILELETAYSELKASYDLFLKRPDFAGASLSLFNMAEIQRLINQWKQAVPLYNLATMLAMKANDLLCGAGIPVRLLLRLPL